jgi:hypothetical protein
MAAEMAYPNDSNASSGLILGSRMRDLNGDSRNGARRHRLTNISPSKQTAATNLANSADVASAESESQNLAAN